ncbi:aspartoacylase [Enhygromyxa salina]|uniref:Aspartoacylase n=1 Tax=Enhygromyxa salina TaxID=215803 RepID=A0A2S9XLU8_9BACT|nr:succinylglutamate desuccinylase/aspartoacylase family protein [Enhygromyxa salina]PRP93835.1 aspartoacylase [Enhygromyxa salina]
MQDRRGLEKSEADLGPGSTTPSRPTPEWPPEGATLTRRWLGAHEGVAPGPTLVIIGGIHGNEPSGVIALQRVLHELRRRRIPVQGRLLGLAGNMRALAHNARFMTRDLNRGWFPDHLARLRDQAHSEDSPEDVEQRELLKIFDRLDETFDHPLVVMDLHSFSAEGPPFSVVADTLRNRPLAYELRAPIIFGLDEAVGGTMLGYLADLGHVAVGFEGGQHDDPRTVENHVAAIWIALVANGLIAREELPELERCEARLAQAAAGLPRAVEIVYRHPITPEDGFRMDPGFHNFQDVRRNQRLAIDRDGEIGSPATGRVLMPLYQGQGEDGFFIARDLGNARLQLSAALRKLEVDRLLPYLPGIEVDDSVADEITVGRVGNRPAVKKVLRLLGYRKDVPADGQLRVARRRQAESKRRGRASTIGEAFAPD